MTRHHPTFSLFLLFAAAAVSCTADMVIHLPDEPDPIPGADDGGTSLPDLAATDDLCRHPHTQAVGPVGARIVISPAESARLAGTTLFVPAGALNGAASLQVGCGAELAGTDEVALGPSVRLLPEGQTFINPVSLTLPYDPAAVPAGSEVAIAVSSGGQRDTLSGSALNLNPAAGTVSTELAHFSDYQVIASRPRPPKPTNNVDVLFVMDNSPSMTPKQKALARSISSFIRGLDQLGLDYHLGVVSTDVGTNVAAGTPWGGSVGSCDTFEGDDGVMQIQPCSSRSSGTTDARNACATLCTDPSFVPGGGSRFISRVAGVTNVPSDMVTDPMTGKTYDNGPTRAFQCIGLLGDGGCGIESPLESIRRALDGHRADNAGFLRPSSLLAVVVLTDEDDCSVQMARRSENSPVTRDCATPDQNASYDCYNLDYRCLARSVICDQPMNSTGDKTNCKERPANYLEPLGHYVTFLQGLRPANRLLVSGIWTQPSIDKGGKVSITYSTGGTTSQFLNRAPGSGASCVYSGDATVFGQAQLRLSSFAAGFGDAQQYSICDLDHLDVALTQITQAIAAKAKK